MLLLAVGAVLAWVAPFAAALVQFENMAALSNAQAAEMLAAAGCWVATNFTVKDFKLWTPVNTNANATTLSFRFVDSLNPSPIDTACHLNATSKSLTAGSAYTPRYSCENRLVNFIWDQNVLNVIERVVCPGQTATARFESSGIARPNATWTCSATGCDAPAGDGTCCVAAELNGKGTNSRTPCQVRDQEEDPLPVCAGQTPQGPGLARAV